MELMELIVPLLSSTGGAVIGTSVGIYLLYRKLRPITGAELDLTRGKLRSTEFSLSATTANLENLKKQLAEREQVFATSDEKTRGLENEIAQLRAQLTEHEGRMQDATKAVAETASRQLASYESQIDADDRQIKELSGQVGRLASELNQYKADLDQEAHGRSSLEAQLSAEHEHSRRLACRIAELEAERSHFDITMQEERQSAAKGIELLLMAQENLKRVFRHMQPESAAAVESTVETNGHVLVAAGASGNGNGTGLEVAE
jgi:chromosome segregation ATPase